MVSRRGLQVALSFAALAAIAGHARPAELPRGDGPPADPRIHVSGGAAPGYVADVTCRACHDDVWRTFKGVAMSHSFMRATPRHVIEDFTNARVLDSATSTVCEMSLRNGRYHFRRYQRDAAGNEINVFAVDVDWILGSGAHARTYLYQTKLGELYQLPIAWYSQSASWGLAPGFELAHHPGVTRQVRRECMFCHNAYPEVPTGADDHWAPQVFPRDLPEGVGCQRCHGPGAAHVMAALVPEPDPERLSATIVNPAHLPPQLQRDVCYQCHMQPTVVLAGVRRFGRGDYSYRPGEALSDYVLKMDIVEEGRSSGERFEINHHPYRLEQSRCYIASGGAIGCLTCHNPHYKVPPANRAAHFRAACRSCHTRGACIRHSGSAPETLDRTADLADDCVACHMPKRRTQDVVNVVMTDHKIQRWSGGASLLAPLVQKVPVILDVTFHEPDRAPGGALADVYRAVAVHRAVRSPAAVDKLAQALPLLKPLSPTPYLDLAAGQLGLGRTEDARATLEAIHRRWPDSPTAIDWLGLAQVRLGHTAEGLTTLEAAVEAAPEEPQAQYNFGRSLELAGRFAEAQAHLALAVRLRPNMFLAWLHLGTVQAARGLRAAAAESLQRALAIEPCSAPAYVSLAGVLAASGNRSEAEYWLRHGVAVVGEPAPLEAALDKLVAGSDGTPAHPPAGPR